MPRIKPHLSGRIFIAGICFLLLAARPTGRAQAHGILIRSEPPDGSTVQEAPNEIRLWFSEPISAEFSAVTLYDRAGQPIRVEEQFTDPNEAGLLIVDLPELADGTYSVFWKVFSESDGHFSQGLMVFSIGAGSQGTQPSAPVAVPLPPTPEVLLRWLNYFFLAGLIGSFAVSRLVWSSQKKIAIFDSSLLVRANLALRKALFLGVICAAGAGLVGLGILAWQAHTMTQSLAGETSIFGFIRQVLLVSRWGRVWVVRMVLSAISGLAFAQLYRSQYLYAKVVRLWNWLWLLAFLLVCGLSLAQALSGHAVGLRSNGNLAVVADTLHILSAGIWVGGTLVMIFIGFPLWRQEKAAYVELLRMWWRSFIPMALISEAILAATGLYSMGRQVASLDALLASSYGQVLLGKIGLMLLMGIIGSLNAPLLYPEIVRPLVKRFHRFVAWPFIRLRRLPNQVLAEVALGVCVLLAAGFITASPPPQQVEFSVAEDVPATFSQNVDDLVITLSASPNRAGENVFTVFARSTRRPPLAEISRVTLRFTNLDVDMGKKSVTGQMIAPDRYLIGGNYLSMSGNWQIDVVIRRLGMEDSVATFNWIVPPVYNRPTLVSKARLEPYLTLAAAIFLSLILAVVTVLWGLNRKRVLKGDASISIISVLMKDKSPIRR